MSWRVWIEPRPGGKFLVRKRTHKGKNGKSKICSTKWIANKLRDKWENELEFSDLGIADPNRSLKEIWEEYKTELERAEQFAYLGSMQQVVPYYIADKDTVEDLTTESVQTYRTHLINSVATATVKSRLRHLGAWLTWVRKKKYIEKSPFVDIEIPDYVPQPKYITDEEIEKIDRAAKGPIKLMWRIAYTTGLRQGNIRTLRGDMIEGDLAIIPRTKGKRPIIAPLEDEVLDLLPHPRPPGPLFPRYSGWNGRWILYKDFEAVKRKAGVRDEITWHRSRHTFVKDALQAGLTTFEAMNYTGHVSTVSMQPYAHFETVRLRERHRLIKAHRLEKRQNASGQVVGRKPVNLKSASKPRKALKRISQTITSRGTGFQTERR